MKEKRAFTDEAIQETLPSEELNLTERHPLDLSSTIQAKSNSGMFLDPAISDNLSKISASIHDARRDSREHEFTSDLIEWDRIKNLESYKTQLALETKAKVFSNDINNRFFNEVHDMWNKAYYDDVERKTVLDNYMQKMQDKVTELNGSGYYYAGAALQSAYQNFYNENLGKALDSDLEMLSIKTKSVIAADFMANAAAASKRGGLSTEQGAYWLGVDTTHKYQFTSNLLHDKAQQIENNELYNEGYKMAIAKIKSEWKASNMTPDQAKDQYLLIASSGSHRIKGYAIFGTADKALYEQNPTLFEEKYGKVVTLTPKELQKTEEGRFILKNGYFDAHANEDGTITLVEREWDVYVTPEVVQLALNAANEIETKKTGPSGALARKKFFESIGVTADGKDIDSNNKLLNTLSFGDLVKYSVTDFIPYYIKDLQGTREQVMSAENDLLTLFSVVFPAKSAKELLSYANAHGLSGEDIDRIGINTQFNTYLNELEHKLNNQPIPDVIKELNFNFGPFMGFDGNLPVEVFQQLSGLGIDTQQFKRAYVNGIFAMYRKEVANSAQYGGAGILKSDSNYNHSIEQITTNIPAIIIETKDNHVGINRATVNQLGRMIDSVTAYTKAQGFETNMHFEQIISGSYSAYKEQPTVERRETFKQAMALLLSDRNVADLLTPDTFAQLEDGQKEYLKSVLKYAMLSGTSQERYFEGIITNASDTGAPTKVSDARLKSIKLLNSPNNAEFEQAVETILNKAKVPVKYRETLRSLAIDMALVSNRNSGNFDIKDFESVVNSKFKEGIFLNASHMNHVDGDKNRNSILATVGKTKEFNERVKEIQLSVDDNNGEINIKHNFSTVKAQTDKGADIPLSIISYTGGMDPKDALFVKTGYAGAMYSVSRYTSNISGDINLIRNLKAFNKDTGLLWNPALLERKSQQWLSTLNNPDKQKSFLNFYKKYGKDEANKILDAKLGPISKLAEFLVNGTYLTEGGPVDKTTSLDSGFFGQRSHLYSDMGVMGEREKEYLQQVEDLRGEKETAILAIKYAMATNSNKNQMALTTDAVAVEEAIKDDGTMKGDIPVKEWGAIVTRDFGEEGPHPVTGKPSGHDGMDFAMNEGTQFNSLVEGTVKFAGDFGSYGNSVIVQARNGDLFLYAHLKSVNKNLVVGSRILESDPVGAVGRTGVTTGPCLHVERRIGTVMRNNDLNAFLKGTPVHPITGETRVKYKESCDKYRKSKVSQDKIENLENILANYAIKASNEMGNFNKVTLQDAKYIYKNLLDNYEPTKEDIASIGRELGVDLQANDKMNVFASLVSRLGIAGSIFEETNIWDARKMAMASIYPGTTFSFVTPDNKTTVQGLSLNDIIALRNKNGLKDYTYGEWNIDKTTPELTAWLKKRGIKNV